MEAGISGDEPYLLARKLPRAIVVVGSDRVAGCDKAQELGADLVVLDRNYMTIPEEEISEIQALMTLLGGTAVYLDPGFAAELQLKPETAVVATYQSLRERHTRF